MLTRTRSLLIYGMLVSLYLSSEVYVACMNKLIVDGVQNLSVKVLPQGQEIAGRKEAYNVLKLNISWLPPNSIRQPSSYSILVTSVSRKGRTSIAECPEGTFFHTSMTNEELYVLVPGNNSLADISDIYIQASCSYKVQVIANPRSKHMVNVSEIFYTVPACIGDACSCTSSTIMLSAPTVNVTRREGEVIVNWNTSLATSFNVQFYTISLGIPVLVSRKGLPVYNKTKIGQVSAGKGMFLWNLGTNGQYVDIKDGYKVIVTPLDYHGCSGPEGGYIINSARYTGKSVIQWHLVWFILIAIVTSCIFFGVSSFIIKYRKHTVSMLSRTNDAVRIHRISKCKSQWKETILRKHNILYVGHECETAGSDDEPDAWKVPFKSVKLIRELGTGQFGKVYLGHLDDTNRTLVAVKMSQEIDVSIDSETRQEFIKEIEIMRMVGNHPHLIQLIGYSIQPNSPTCILLEYMHGGDLLTYLHRKKKQRCNSAIALDGSNGLQDLSNRCVSDALYTTIRSSVSSKRNIYELGHDRNIAVVRMKDAITINTKDAESTKESWFGQTKGREFLRFATEIAMGMEHLEAKGITHRDLAARNILLSKDSTIKISDFGLSRNGVYVIENIKEKTRHLPIRWMSPEALHNRAFSSKSDVWSFGVVLWEIATLGAFPYSRVGDDCLLRYIVYENGRLKRPNDVPSIIYKLMLSCWASDPENRPNFAQLLFTLRTLPVSLNSHLCTVSNPCYTLARPNDTD